MGLLTYIRQAITTGINTLSSFPQPLSQLVRNMLQLKTTYNSGIVTDITQHGNMIQHVLSTTLEKACHEQLQFLSTLEKLKNRYKLFKHIENFQNLHAVITQQWNKLKNSRLPWYYIMSYKISLTYKSFKCLTTFIYAAFYDIGSVFITQYAKYMINSAIMLGLLYILLGLTLATAFLNPYTVTIVTGIVTAVVFAFFVYKLVIYIKDILNAVDGFFKILEDAPKTIEDSKELYNYMHTLDDGFKKDIQETYLVAGVLKDLITQSHTASLLPEEKADILKNYPENPDRVYATYATYYTPMLPDIHNMHHRQVRLLADHIEESYVAIHKKILRLEQEQNSEGKSLELIQNIRAIYSLDTLKKEISQIDTIYKKLLKEQPSSPRFLQLKSTLSTHIHAVHQAITVSPPSPLSQGSLNYTQTLQNIGLLPSLYPISFPEMIQSKIISSQFEQALSHYASTLCIEKKLVPPQGPIHITPKTRNTLLQLHTELCKHTQLLIPDTTIHNNTFNPLSVIQYLTQTLNETIQHKRQSPDPQETRSVRALEKLIPLQKELENTYNKELVQLTYQHDLHYMQLIEELAIEKVKHAHKDTAQSSALTECIARHAVYSATQSTEDLTHFCHALHHYAMQHDHQNIQKIIADSVCMRTIDFWEKKNQQLWSKQHIDNLSIADALKRLNLYDLGYTLGQSLQDITASIQFIQSNPLNTDMLQMQLYTITRLRNAMIIVEYEKKKWRDKLSHAIEDILSDDHALLLNEYRAFVISYPENYRLLSCALAIIDTMMEELRETEDADQQLFLGQKLIRDIGKLSMYNIPHKKEHAFFIKKISTTLLQLLNIDSTYTQDNTNLRLGMFRELDIITQRCQESIAYWDNNIQPALTRQQHIDTIAFNIQESTRAIHTAQHMMQPPSVAGDTLLLGSTKASDSPSAFLPITAICDNVLCGVQAIHNLNTDIVEKFTDFLQGLNGNPLLAAIIEDINNHPLNIVLENPSPPVPQVIEDIVPPSEQSSWIKTGESYIAGVTTITGVISYMYSPAMIDVLKSIADMDRYAEQMQHMLTEELRRVIGPTQQLMADFNTAVQPMQAIMQQYNDNNKKHITQDIFEQRMQKTMSIVLFSDRERPILNEIMLAILILLSGIIPGLIALYITRLKIYQSTKKDVDAFQSSYARITDKIDKMTALHNTVTEHIQTLTTLCHDQLGTPLSDVLTRITHTHMQTEGIAYETDNDPTLLQKISLFSKLCLDPNISQAALVQRLADTVEMIHTLAHAVEGQFEPLTTSIYNIVGDIKEFSDLVRDTEKDILNHHARLETLQDMHVTYLNSLENQAKVRDKAKEQSPIQLQNPINNAPNRKY